MRAISFIHFWSIFVCGNCCKVYRAAMETTNKFVFRSFGCLLFDIDCLKPCSGSIFGDEHADETRWLRDLFESSTVKMRIRLIHLLFTHLFPHCGLWAALIEQKTNTTQQIKNIIAIEMWLFSLVHFIIRTLSFFLLFKFNHFRQWFFSLFRNFHSINNFPYKLYFA